MIDYSPFWETLKKSNESTYTSVSYTHLYCPICGNKTRTMIREDTELRNFPLYCPKCKKETIINAQDMKVTLAEHKYCLLYTSRCV